MTGPILLGYSTTSSDNEEWKRLPAHEDEEQVQKDVDRAFVYYPSSEIVTAKRLQANHVR